MSLLSYQIPELGDPSKTQDPRTATALTNILSWGNGAIDSSNIATEGIKEESLSAAVVAKLSKEAKSLAIATEQVRTSTSYGLLSTPDELEIVMPANGLIGIAYQAVISQSTGGATSLAAIFLGSNQLKIPALSNTVPIVQAAGPPTASTGGGYPLSTFWGGLICENIAVTYAGDVTTGQVVGSMGNGGPTFVFAAAGTYKVTVQFKASTGSVTVKERKLWCWRVV